MGRCSMERTRNKEEDIGEESKIGKEQVCIKRKKRAEVISSRELAF